MRLYLKYLWIIYHFKLKKPANAAHFYDALSDIKTDGVEGHKHKFIYKISFWLNNIDLINFDNLKMTE